MDGSVRRCSLALASFCTRSTAASAVRPVLTASRSRRSQPRSWATMRKVSSTSRCSPGPILPRSIRLSIDIAHRRDRLVEALHLLLHIFGDELLDDDARLVQHDMAEADALGEGAPFSASARRVAMSAPGWT